MFDKERIIYQIERTRVLTLQLVERIPHDTWFTMPMDISHIAWNVGHIATAEYFLGMVFVRGIREDDSRLIPENYVELFGYNSVPQSDPDLYPTPQELLDTLDAVHQQLGQRAVHIEKEGTVVIPVEEAADVRLVVNRRLRFVQVVCA